jgi:hypothetical protein
MRIGGRPVRATCKRYNQEVRRRFDVGTELRASTLPDAVTAL